MISSNKIEPIVLLLVFLVIFFSVVLVGVAVFLSSDGQTFQIIAGLVTGFSGALLMRVKPRTSESEVGPDSTLTRTRVSTEVIEPSGKESKEP